MSRMPEGTPNVPQTTSDFMKLEEGNNKFRVLSAPVVGYETWIEEDGKKKPLRSKTRLEKEPANISIGKYGTQFNRYFRAFVIWNYDAKAIQFLHLDKKGVLKDIENYLGMEKKKDPTMYDMVIIKKGTGTDTEYSLIVDENEKLDKDIQKKWDAIKTFVKVEGHLDGEYVLKAAMEMAEVPVAKDTDLPF